MNSFIENDFDTDKLKLITDTPAERFGKPINIEFRAAEGDRELTP